VRDFCTQTQGGPSPQALAYAAIRDAAQALGWRCVGLEAQLEQIQQQQQQQQQGGVGVANGGAMTERDAVSEVAKGVDAAIMLGPAGSIPKWLTQQQVCC